ncbi:hypothetical protein L2216_21260, partial [Xanthomonas perforans]|nr:hypothetical protein [Xanthomonas perforans]
MDLKLGEAKFPPILCVTNKHSQHRCYANRQAVAGDGLLARRPSPSKVPAVACLHIGGDAQRHRPHRLWRD